MAEDTETLKHNFFFKGFFNHCGYYTLGSLSPEEYRHSKLFGSTQSPRAWLHAHALFQHGALGTEELSPDGKHAIDAAVASFRDAIFTHPIVIEGYSDATTSADALSWSYARAQLVRNYLEARYPFSFPLPEGDADTSLSPGSRDESKRHSAVSLFSASGQPELLPTPRILGDIAVASK